jgi:hypothetical protein
MAYYKHQPFGPDLRDERTARIMMLTAEIHRDEDKRNRPFEVEDFMPDYGPPTDDEPEDWEAILHQVELMNKAFGGRDLRDQDDEE